VALQLHPFLKQAAKLSSNNEEEAYLFGIIVKKARQDRAIDDYAENFIRKAAEQLSCIRLKVHDIYIHPYGHIYGHKIEKQL
jgi:hypothetical protein